MIFKEIDMFHAFQYLFNKFWDDKQKVTILGYEEPTFKLEDNFDFMILHTSWVDD